MAKRNGSVAVIPAPFTIQKDGGKEVNVILSDSLKREVIALATEVGGFIRTAEQKIQTALNITAAFREFKRITGSGLPAFAQSIDPTVPHASYGAAGSKERRELVAHTFFCGLEYLIKKGNAAMERAAERKALIDAGVDVNDAEKVKEHQKDVRETNTAKFTKAFTKCIVDFVRIGITDVTVGNLLIVLG